MVMPTSTEDVQKIAKVFSENECTFGMRSGAHSAWAGSNGVKEGVTVDFCKLLAKHPLCMLFITYTMMDSLHKRHRV
jgi:FAD/FMN-containing dehydrogenase